MNKNLKLALVTAIAVSFTASADTKVNGLVNSHGHTVTNNFGECVEAKYNVENVDCGAEAPMPEKVVNAPFTLGAHALFDTNKSIIKAAGKAKLDKLAMNVKQGMDLGKIKSVTDILVVGHTDSRASNAYNQGLSERRAASVRNYLINAGVSPSMLTARGEGEVNPVADNSTAAGRQENRRVEVTISGYAKESK